MLKVMDKLAGCEIYPRRYFYPSLNKLPYLNGNECPVSENITQRVLCLPLYQELEIKDVKFISEIIKNNLL